MQLEQSCTRRSFRLLSASATLATLLSVGGAVAHAQALELPAPSPKARLEQQVGVTSFQLEYSSPAVKGRKIWGALVPYDKLWRTGANAATKLTVSRDFSFGGKPVKAGSYALYTIPGKSSWTVILNTNANTGGTSGYEEKNDVARITVKPARIPLRERLTFIFNGATDSGVALDLEWEKLRIRVPITLDTAGHVKANIEKALADAWRPHFAAARYLVESGGDLTVALGYADRSIAIQPTWWNHWTRAQILGKQGKKADAVAAAQQAQALGKGDQVFEGFFKEDVAKAIAGWK